MLPDCRFSGPFADWRGSFPAADDLYPGRANSGRAAAGAGRPAPFRDRDSTWAEPVIPDLSWNLAPGEPSGEHRMVVTAARSGAVVSGPAW